jgi:rod shape-determining protein MreD
MRSSGPISYFLLYILLVLLQLLIFSKMHFSGYINPYVYILFILLLPFDIPGWVLLVTSFGLGLTVDIFLDSMGIHAAASTLLAFSRPAVIRLITIRSDFEQGAVPSISSQGFNWILIYSLLSILIHHTMLFFLEIFRLTEFWDTLYRIVLSSLFTWMFILIGYFIIDRRSR